VRESLRLGTSIVQSFPFLFLVIVTVERSRGARRGMAENVRVGKANGHSTAVPRLR
jgi:hypothetical protein